MLSYNAYFSVSEQLRSAVNECHSGNNELKIIGQELDETFIFSWNKKLTESEHEVSITHIGAFNPNSKYPKTLYIFEKETNVVSCTVNQEQTFIGFVIKENKDVSGPQGKRIKQDVYKGYLAEVQPQGRVFYLNLERENYIKLQFLYGQYKTHISPRESHMLVFLHRESIGLYHLPLARAGDRGMVMSEEPKKEQIWNKKYVWYQWDNEGQRLHVIHFRKQGRGENKQYIYKPFLTSFQFNQQVLKYPELVLDLPLDLPLAKPKTNEKVYYYTDGPFSSTPDILCHLQVLTQSNGSVYVCYQHPVNYKPTRTQKKNQEESSTTLKYSVIIVHHEKVLHGQCEYIPLLAAEKAILLFAILGDYLVVHLTNYFTHLLNLGIELEPSHHILWHDNTSTIDLDFEPNHVVKVVKDSSLVMLQPSVSMFDMTDGISYKLSINNNEMVEIFSKTKDIALKMAVLHYSVIHSKDLALTRELFDLIARDVTALDVEQILEEFLIASTYSQIRRQLDKLYLMYLPFTTCDTFRGHGLYSYTKVRVASLSYSNMAQATFGDKRAKKHDDLWDHLASFVRQRHQSVAHRFSNNTVKGELDVDLMELSNKNNNDIPKPPNVNSSLFQKLSAAAKSAFTSTPNIATAQKLESPNSPTDEPRRPSSRSEIILGTPPPFLTKEQKEEDIKMIVCCPKTVQLLSDHFIKYLRRESKTKIRNVVEEFVKCQMYSSKLLAHLIWSLLAPNDLPEELSVVEKGGEEELELFVMFERYFLATQELGFPTPPGFDLFFTTLGYRCLDYIVFQQYIDRAVLTVTPEFVSQIIEDLDDSPHNIKVKLKLLSCLHPIKKAHECLVHWKHQICNHYMAKHYTESILCSPTTQDKIPEVTNFRFEGGGSWAAIEEFAPLNRFTELLERNDPSLRKGTTRHEFNIDTTFVRDVAMLNTAKAIHQQLTDT